MASPLRISDPPNAAQLEARAKDFVLKHVTEKGPVTPTDLYQAVRNATSAPFSIAQFAMWDLIAHGMIEFTKDYQLQIPSHP